MEAGEEELTIEVFINSSDEIAGFQFGISGLVVPNGTGFEGLASDYGIIVSTGPTGILGFSLDASSIPSTNGEELLLTKINYTAFDETSPQCVTDIVLSDPSADALTNNYIIHHESNCPISPSN